MPREAEPSLNEKQFFTKALTKKIRLDGRGSDELRSLELQFGDRHGIVDFRLGGTRIHTQISAEVTKPHPDRPFEGLFTIVTELSPMTHPHLEQGRPSQTEVLISRLLEKTIRHSGALDPESLCLVAGQACWSIRADVHVISTEGNIIDAVSVAVISALAHFRKPEADVTGGIVTVYTLSEREPVPLSLLHWPLCITFSFYGLSGEGNEKKWLIDATELEEQMRDGCVTIGMNRHGEICQLSKLGGVPVDALMLLSCVSLATAKVQVLSEFISRQLQEDTRRRDKGGLISELLSSENARVS